MKLGVQSSRVLRASLGRALRSAGFVLWIYVCEVLESSQFLAACAVGKPVPQPVLPGPPKWVK